MYTYTVLDTYTHKQAALKTLQVHANELQTELAASKAAKRDMASALKDARADVQRQEAEKSRLVVKWEEELEEEKEKGRRAEEEKRKEEGLRHAAENKLKEMQEMSQAREEKLKEARSAAQSAMTDSDKLKGWLDALMAGAEVASLDDLVKFVRETRDVNNSLKDELAQAKSEIDNLKQNNVDLNWEYSTMITTNHELLGELNAAKDYLVGG